MNDVELIFFHGRRNDRYHDDWSDDNDDYFVHDDPNDRGPPPVDPRERQRRERHSIAAAAAITIYDDEQGPSGSPADAITQEEAVIAMRRQLAEEVHHDAMLYEMSAPPSGDGTEMGGAWSWST